MKYIEKIAIFLIWLVLTIPLNSSIAYAALGEVRIYGQDGVDNVIASEEDFLTAQVLMPPNFTDSTKMSIDYPGTSRFGTCKNVQGGMASLCEFQSGLQPFVSDKKSVTITEVDGNGTLIEKKTTEIYIDGIPPEIVDINFERIGDEFKLNYDIKERACLNCGSACLGLESLSFVKNYDIKKTLYVNDSNCDAKANLTGPLSYFGLTESDNEICLLATDKGGLSSGQFCLENSFDITNPEVVIGSFKVKDVSGNEIEYLSRVRHTNATLTVNISDLDLDTDSLIGNFTSFNTLLGMNYDNLQANCRKSGDSKFVCSWDILLRGDTGKKEFRIQGRDKAGNLLDYKAYVELKGDSTSPTFNRFFTNREIDADALYVKSGENRIYSEFANDGSGYNLREVYIDISFDNHQIQNERADECYLDEANDVWLCYWDIVLAPPSELGSPRASLNRLTTDDAGNSIPSPIYYEIKFDAESPEVLSVIKSKACPYAGESLELQIKVRDDSPVTAVTKPKIITDRNFTYSTDCDTVEEGVQLCELRIQDFVPYHAEERITINITDNAMNKVQEQVELEVCLQEKLNITGDNYYTKVRHFSNSKIDRRTLSFVSLPAVVNLNIDTYEGAEVIDKNVKCDQKIELAYLVDEESDKPQIVARLAKTNAKHITETTTSIDFSCTLSLVVKRGDKVYSTPEVHHLNITLPNHKALGAIDGEMEKKIKEVQDSIDDLDSDISTWESWNMWMGLLCRLAEAMALVNAVMGLLKSVMFIVTMIWTSVSCEAAQKDVTPMKAAECGSCHTGWTTWSAVCGFMSTFDKFIADWIWYPGFWGGMPTSSFIKIFCIIYSCKLCKGDFTEAVGENIAFGATDPYKSIHAASACLCVSGVIYNLKKQKQITCMYKSCLERNAEAGLPTDVCDRALKERTCLYVDGAQWKLRGSGVFGGFIANFLTALIASLPSIAAGIGWDIACTSADGYNELGGCAVPVASEFGPTDPCLTGTFVGDPKMKSGDTIMNPQLSNLLCHISGSALQVLAIDAFSTILDADKYNVDFEGDEAC